MIMKSQKTSRKIERVQTGVRMERRMLKVLKGLAEYLDISLAELLEGIVLHSLENRPIFHEKTVERIGQLKQIYNLDLGAEDAHTLSEEAEE